MSIDKITTDDLCEKGWSKEGADFILSKKDEPDGIRILRWLFRKTVQIKLPKQKKEYIPNHIRWGVWERDNFTCQQCGSRKYLSVDHIKPESRGGTLDPENLQTLCSKCNSSKGARQ